jgi:uncharacterized phage-associated protein
MCYLASTIARYFIEKANGSKTNLQINKMVYIAHGWYLALHDKPLILEDIEAWKYGPVIPELFHEFKKYRGDPIPHRPIEETKHIKDADKGFLDRIIEVYGNWTGYQLSAKTHEKGTPWYKTKKWYRTGSYVIPERVIKEYYIEKIKHSTNGV